MRRYKLRQKEVVAVSWNDDVSQAKAIEDLKELGCTDVKVTSSGAGISIDFKYPTPNSFKPIYYGSLFYTNVMVFENNGTYPEVHSGRDFDKLYELDNE